MLSVYSRHYPPCTSDDINYKRCRCPKWANGILGCYEVCEIGCDQIDRTRGLQHSQIGSALNVEEEWVGAGKSSSARVVVRWTGVRFGSGFSQLDTEAECTVFNSCDYALPSPTAQYRREQFRGSS